MHKRVPSQMDVLLFVFQIYNTAKLLLVMVGPQVTLHAVSSSGGGSSSRGGGSSSGTNVAS